MPRTIWCRIASSALSGSRTACRIHTESRAGFASGDKYEMEADYFAAGLLMPQQLFIPAMRQAGEGLDRPREVLVAVATGDLEEVLPELLFRIGIDQHVLGRIMHAAQVARVL